MASFNNNVNVIELYNKINSFSHLYTIIRNKETQQIAWKNAANRIMNVNYLLNLYI